VDHGKLLQGYIGGEIIDIGNAGGGWEKKELMLLAGALVLSMRGDHMAGKSVTTNDIHKR